VTDENRRRNLADELARARQSLRAAESLVELGLHADSVSRAYYAAYHFLRALLLSRGLEPKTHAGAIHLFNTEFVRAGTFPSSHNRVLAGLQRARELADYDSAVEFSADDAQVLGGDAQSFGDEVQAFLRSEGWIDA
jgi:hypothetical protein